MVGSFTLHHGEGEIGLRPVPALALCFILRCCDPCQKRAQTNLSNLRISYAWALLTYLVSRSWP